MRLTVETWRCVEKKRDFKSTICRLGGNKDVVTGAEGTESWCPADKFTVVLETAS